MSDRQSILEALGSGGRTFQVAKRLGWSTPRARYYLIQLERAGKVHRAERLTYDNDIYWRPSMTPADIERVRGDRG